MGRRAGGIRNSNRDRTDRNGNIIGSGDNHVDYKVFDFSKSYPQIVSSVQKSNTTESVYVRYLNTENMESVTVRFAWHENNAVRYGDQLNGSLAKEDEVLYRLGLKERVFVPETYLKVPYRQIKMRDVKNYKEAPLTIEQIYELGEGANLDKYKGMVAKNSNFLLEGWIMIISMNQYSIHGQNHITIIGEGSIEQLYGNMTSPKNATCIQQ